MVDATPDPAALAQSHRGTGNTSRPGQTASCARQCGDIVGMEHHACVEKIRGCGSFDTPYTSGVHAYPLGEEPILMTTVNFVQHPNQPIRINMTPQQGQGFEIAFPLPVLHGFCSLLKDAVEKAEWQIQLAMPGAQQRTHQLLN